MFNHSMQVTIEGAVSSIHGAEESFFLRVVKGIRFSPFNLLATGFTGHINKANIMMADVCLKLRGIAQQIEQNTDADLIDANFVIRDRLEDLKKAVTLIRKSYDGASNKLSARSKLRIAFTNSYEVAAEVYAAANQLQWAIVEHDADFTKRLGGCVAQSKEESDRILDRLMAKSEI